MCRAATFIIPHSFLNDFVFVCLAVIFTSDSCHVWPAVELARRLGGAKVHHCSMKRRASSSSSGAVSRDSFEKHLASCIRSTSSSAFKQTWELSKPPVPLLQDFSVPN